MVGGTALLIHVSSSARAWYLSARHAVLALGSGFLPSGRRSSKAFWSARHFLLASRFLGSKTGCKRQAEKKE